MIPLDFDAEDGDEQVQTDERIQIDLWTAVRRRGIDEGKTVQDIIIESLEAYMEDRITPRPI